MNKPTAISLFTGVGGFDLGVERAGFKVVGANEIDFKTASTYSKNFKTPIIIDDVRKVSGNNLRDSGGIGRYTDVDLVFGGSPCQGFSQAGKRDPNDHRNSLIFEYQRLVLDIYPKYFIFENVSELLNPRNKDVLDKFTNGLYDEGYYIQIKTLDASNYGVPQTRKRVFMIGNRCNYLMPSFPPESKENFTLYDAIADLKFTNGYEKLRYVDSVSELVYDEPSNYVKNYHKLLGSNIDFAKVIRPITASKFTRHDYETIKAFKSYSQGYRESFARRCKPVYDDVCPTVVTKQRLIHPIYPRYLTVRECARIQSFIDDFTFHHTIEQGQKEVGNAVPPLLGYKLAKQIIDVL
ncbi:cytosine-specific methyltransferase [Nostoc phage YongM]|nr:cytosine-specific methyltransferase [Nostoc phage YongM]